MRFYKKWEANKAVTKMLGGEKNSEKMICI